MCILSYTSYNNCGCARVHATLPCHRAFNTSFRKCVLMKFMQYDEVEGDCPECKPAFDNKSGLKPRIKLNFKRESPRPQRAIMQAVQRQVQQQVQQQVQHQGTFDEIDQHHNQFRHFDRQTHASHKTQLFLNWLDDPQHPGPEGGDKPAHHAMTVSRKQQQQQRQPSAWHHNLDARGKISPSPPSTPPATMTQTFSVPVRLEYTLRARHHRLTASQREAMRPLGYGHIRRLSVISRRHHRQQQLSDATTSSGSDEYITTTRRHTLSASQRSALRRSGHGSVRRLSVVARRRRHQSN